MPPKPAARFDPLPFVAALALAGLLAALALLARGGPRAVARPRAKAEPADACSASTCGALDPVDDPAYNMREVAKQTLLLEQHLAEPRKLCRACSVKHLLLCCGLLEEAAWMAGARAPEYPHLLDAMAEYDRLLRTWPWRTRGSEVPDQVRREVLECLRARRRQLVDAYLMHGGDTDEIPDADHKHGHSGL